MVGWQRQKSVFKTEKNQTGVRMMKKFLKKASLLILLAMSFVSFAFAAACSGETSDVKTSGVESLRLSETDITLEL